MEKNLELYFKNEKGKTVTLVVKEPADGLELATVANAQKEIVAANVFTTSGGDLKEAAGASYVTKDVEPLA
nr:DUF2922 domain-containing protein [uncultured Phascolarctobacterium sp.]